MNTLESWVAVVCNELGLDGEVDRDAVLDTARDVAHAVARPAAPLTAYLMGRAVGAGADPGDVARRVRALAEGWPAE